MREREDLGSRRLLARLSARVPLTVMSVQCSGEAGKGVRPRNDEGQAGLGLSPVFNKPNA